MGLIVGSLVIASFVHFSGAQTSSTIVSGIINSNTTWTMAGSPYMFNGTVVVNNGVTLIIPAGVTVNLNGYTLQVNGTLQAISSATNQIQFQTNSSGGGGISFMPSSSSWNQQTSSGCIIQNANLTTPISITNASPLIDSSQITIQTGTAISASGSPIISNNIIETQSPPFEQSQGIALNNQVSAIISNNTIRDLQGVNFSGGGIVVGGTGLGNTIISGNSISGWYNGISTDFNSTIEGNLVFSQNGYKFGGSGIYVSGTGNSILNNTVINNPTGILVDSPAIISGNNIYDSLYTTASTFNVNATYNWWGTTNQQAISQTISGNVAFVPFLTSPNTEAPTYSYINATANSGGSISPSGIVYTENGGSQLFTITPNAGSINDYIYGYYIANVLVNGTSVGAVSSYTVQNIDGPTTFTAIFAPNPSPTPQPSFTPNYLYQSTASPTQAHITTSNPTSQPTIIPELSDIAVLTLLLSTLSISVIVKHRKPVS